MSDVKDSNGSERRTKKRNITLVVNSQMSRPRKSTSSPEIGDEPPQVVRRTPQKKDAEKKASSKAKEKPLEPEKSINGSSTSHPLVEKEKDFEVIYGQNGEMSIESDEIGLTISEPKTFADYEDCLNKEESIETILDHYEAFVKPDRTYTNDDGTVITISLADSLREMQKRLMAYIKAFEKLYPPYNLKRIERNLDYLLAKRGMTRNELENFLNLGTSYFNRVFNENDEKRRMSADILWNVCSYFDITTDRFLGEDLQKTDLAGESKAQAFLEQIVAATKNRKLKWVPTNGFNISFDAEDDISYHDDYEKDDEILLNRSLFIETRRTSMNRGDLVFVWYDGSKEDAKEIVNYRLGIVDGEKIKWLVETINQGQSKFRTQCQQIKDTIVALEAAGYMSAEVEETMDDIMNELGLLGAD